MSLQLDIHCLKWRLIPLGVQKECRCAEELLSLHNIPLKSFHSKPPYSISAAIFYTDPIAFFHQSDQNLVCCFTRELLVFCSAGWWVFSVVPYSRQILKTSATHGAHGFFSILSVRLICFCMRNLGVHCVSVGSCLFSVYPVPHSLPDYCGAEVHSSTLGQAAAASWEGVSKDKLKQWSLCNSYMKTVWGFSFTLFLLKCFIVKPTHQSVGWKAPFWRWSSSEKILLVQKILKDEMHSCSQWWPNNGVKLVSQRLTALISIGASLGRRRFMQARVQRREILDQIINIYFSKVWWLSTCVYIHS